MPLDLDNRTPFACAHPPMNARNGASILRVIVRATYDIRPDGTLSIAPKQAPVRMEDVYWGEEGKSSLRYETDVSLEKPFVDLLVNGLARPSNGRPATFVDVGLMFDNRMVKHMRVFGDRYWDYGVAGWRLTDPKPFATMPVIYDRAYGGMDEAGSEPRNRAGKGYTSKLSTSFAGTPAPNVEQIDALIRSPKDRPKPAGLGIISRDWQQRSRFAGTYDERWLEDRFPLLPDDFDMRFNQSAPEEQWIRSVKGGEWVRVVGLTADGGLGFRLPHGNVNLGLHYRKKSVEGPMQLDSILVDCELRRVELTWRTSADVHGDPFQLETMVVCTDSVELAPKVSPCDCEPPAEQASEVS
jgi:hypothetical protein